MTTSRINTPPNFKPGEEAAIASFVNAFKDTMSLLKAASEVRFTPAPRSFAAKGTGPDPTSDAALEPTRMEVDRAIHSAAVLLQRSAHDLQVANAALTSALDAYMS